MHGRINNHRSLTALIGVAALLLIAAPAHSDELAELREQVEQLNQSIDAIQARRLGDLNGDGNIDDADIAILLENWTGPRPRKQEQQNEAAPIPGQPAGSIDSIDPIDPGFTRIDQSGAVLLRGSVTAEQLQAALDQHDKVGLPAGARVRGAFEIKRSQAALFAYGSGPRPIIEVPKGQNGVDLTADRIDAVIIQGIEIKGPALPHRGREQGIRLRLSASDNQYAKDVRIEDCRVSGFDTLIEVVDDKPRIDGRQREDGGYRQAGRIRLAVIGNILTHAEGSDSHSVGVYIEGLAEGSKIADNAIAFIRIAEPDKRSHGIYAQSIGAPATFTGNLIHRCSAQGIQARAGGTLTDNLIHRCGVGLFIQGEGSVVRRNAVIYGVDITDDEPRGHAYQLVFGKGVIEDNLAAFNRGTQRGVPAFKDLWNPESFERNLAIEWHGRGENFDVSGQGRHVSFGSNRTLDAEGIEPPTIDLDAWLTRERGQAVPSVADTIAQLKEAID